MFAEQPQRMTFEEFLEWEQLQDEKHEFIDGAPVLRRLRKWPDADPNTVEGYATMMAGGARKHHRIALNIIKHLQRRLPAGPCEPFGSDLLVRIPNGRARYPDVHVHCVDYPDQDAYTVDEPTAVFEVLSPSYRPKQMMELLDDYGLIPSVRQIVLVEGRRPFLINSLRTETGWRREELEGLDAILPLAAIGTELPFGGIYERVSFPA